MAQTPIGGQKARISLARAVYYQADVYILDDPLSAVDTKVGRALFEDCIQGFLKSKAVLLVTHQLQFVMKCDRVLLLENGRPVSFGTFDYVANHALCRFAEAMRDFLSRPNLDDTVDDTADVNAEGIALSPLPLLSKSNRTTDERNMDDNDEDGEEEDVHVSLVINCSG